MATIKHTIKGQDARKERLEALRERRARLQEISSLKFGKEWDKLVSLLRSFVIFAKREEEIALRDHDAEEIDSATLSRRLIRSRQKAADFELVSDLLEKTESQVEVLDAEISRIEEQYKEAAQQI